MSLRKDMAGADGVVAASFAGSGGAPIGRAGVHGPRSGSDVGRSLRSSWSRQVLGSLRSLVLPCSIAFLLLLIGRSLADGKPIRWELMLGPLSGWLLLALLMPLFKRDLGTLYFDGRRIHRRGSLQTPLFIRIAELDVERSQRRTLLDRVIGRQRLVNKDGRGIEYFRLWYQARERDDFLAECFEAAEASAERVASGPVPRRAL